MRSHQWIRRTPVTIAVFTALGLLALILSALSISKLVTTNSSAKNPETAHELAQAVSNPSGDVGANHVTATFSIATCPAPLLTSPAKKSQAKASRDLSGTSEKDRITGTSREDRIAGGAGFDEIFSGAGDDVIAGGEGNDFINAGSGNDCLRGGTGADSMLGEDGRDRLYGGSGRDILNGGKGRDFYRGGTGNDEILSREGVRTHDGKIRPAFSDIVFCGPGKDKVLADAIDRVADDCETVKIPPRDRNIER